MPSESPRTINAGAAIARTSCSGQAYGVVMSCLTFAANVAKSPGFGAV